MPYAFPASHAPESFPPSGDQARHRFRPDIVFHFASTGIFVLVTFLLLRVGSTFPITPSRTIHQRQVATIRVIKGPFSRRRLHHDMLLTPFPPASPANESHFQRPPFQEFQRAPFPASGRHFVFPLWRTTTVHHRTSDKRASRLSHHNGTIGHVNNDLRANGTPMATNTLYIGRFCRVCSFCC